MHIPFVDLGRQFSAYRSEYQELFSIVGQSGQYVGGEFVDKFEIELGHYCGVKHAIAFGNGTDSLWMTLLALNIGAGDEVITAPNSFIATAGAIAAVDAKIVFCDVDQDLNIDPRQIEDKITNKTKAIIPVHLTGRPACMDMINHIACANDILVIEDSAQAIGAE